MKNLYKLFLVIILLGKISFCKVNAMLDSWTLLGIKSYLDVGVQEVTRDDLIIDTNAIAMKIVYSRFSRVLNLHNMSITDEFLVEIVSCLNHFQIINLHEIDLSCNLLNGYKFQSQIFHSFVNLIKLDLSENDCLILINNEKLLDIKEFLPANCTFIAQRSIGPVCVEFPV